MRPEIESIEDYAHWEPVIKAAQLTAAPRKLRGRPLWAFVRDLTAFGSTRSAALCRRYGWDPDQSANLKLN